MPCCNLLEIDCATGLLWPTGKRQISRVAYYACIYRYSAVKRCQGFRSNCMLRLARLSHAPLKPPVPTPHKGPAPEHLNFSVYAPWIAAGEASRGPRSHSDAALCVSVVVLRT